MDLDDPGHIVALHVYLNETWLGAALANEYRKDVFDAGFGNGYSGFWFRNFTIEILRGRVQPGDRLRVFLDNDPRHELSNSPLIIDADKLRQVTAAADFSENFPGREEPVKFRMYALGGNDNIVRKMLDEGLKGYEKPLPTVLYHLLNLFDGLFLDIGANSGMYSLLATAVGHAPVIAFEPLPLLHDLLLCNLELNGYAKKIHAERLAISSSTGKLKFYIPPSIGEIETSASLERSFKDKHAEIIDVEASTLDEYLESRDLASERVAVIKVDVEGHEPAVLQGSLRTVNTHRPIIITEILPNSNLGYFDDFKSTQAYTDFVFTDDGMLMPRETQFHPNQYNHIFIPTEALSDQVMALLGGITCK
ncbi:MAG: FkbM family methyltransferase [Methylococcus sp.]